MAQYASASIQTRVHAHNYLPVPFGAPGCGANGLELLLLPLIIESTGYWSHLLATGRIARRAVYNNAFLRKVLAEDLQQRRTMSRRFMIELTIFVLISLITIFIILIDA
jgi:hypothetical protein